MVGAEDFSIRPAVAGDVPALFRLVRELAEYEKLAHEIVATETLLHTALFGPAPKAEALIAEVKGEPCGFCLFFHTFSTFLGRAGIYIEDLYVVPASRGAGMGGALMKAVVRLAKQRGCGRVEWAALDWNTPAIDFYTALGARCMTEWKIFRLAHDSFDAILEK